jgi:hypothetical protein
MASTVRDALLTMDGPGRPKFGLPVCTLHQTAFASACTELMRLVEVDYAPILVVGIRTGGLVVAQSMIRAASTPLPILALTCRRELTQVKSRLKPVRTLLSALPQPAANLLRRVEHRLITAPVSPGPPRQIDRTSREHRHCVTMLPAPTRPVIDDAVDSSHTAMRPGLAYVRPPGPIRSAVITQTLDRPIVRPDYVLHRGTLCRFPVLRCSPLTQSSFWSLISTKRCCPTAFPVGVVLIIGTLPGVGVHRRVLLSPRVSFLLLRRKIGGLDRGRLPELLQTEWHAAATVGADDGQSLPGNHDTIRAAQSAVPVDHGRLGRRMHSLPPPRLTTPMVGASSGSAISRRHRPMTIQRSSSIPARANAIGYWNS